jgi:hypothetical protein
MGAVPLGVSACGQTEPSCAAHQLNVPSQTESLPAVTSTCASKSICRSSMRGRQARNHSGGRTLWASPPTPASSACLSGREMLFFWSKKQDWKKVYFFFTHRRCISIRPPAEMEITKPPPTTESQLPICGLRRERDAGEANR